MNTTLVWQDLFVAGTDTSAATIEWTMAELIRNPAKMMAAKEELESVIGNKSLIEESDTLNLPYLQAVIKEALRLHPVLPLLIPRKASTEVEINGYVVPKNARILVNIWAYGRDEGLWERPECFEPERFLGNKIELKGQNYELIPFGSGRRMCPGMPLALRAVTLVVATLIHNFDWKLDDGITPENMNMDDKFKFSLQKAVPLKVFPIPKFEHVTV